MGPASPDDEFEQFASRRLDRGTSQRPDRPEWLTATGKSEAHDIPPDMEAEPEPHDPPAQRKWTGPAPGAGEWENAVGRVEHDDGLEPEIRFHSKSAGGFRIPGLQSVVAALAKSPPLVFVALAVIAVVALMMFRPREEQTARIAAIRNHPERFDGRPVKVKGRVGEVFEVGGGYAFHLYQGRDEIVVFTRSRVPVRREEVTIAGSISTGMLDGKPRQALFETAR